MLTLADTAEVMRWYRELLPSLPEELSGWIGLITIPAGSRRSPRRLGPQVCVIVWCYTGSHDRADEVLEPVMTYGSPLLVGVQAMPFSVLQSAFDGLYPAGLQWYWRADFFNEISDAAIDVHVKHGAQLPTSHSTMHMYPIDAHEPRARGRDGLRLPGRRLGWRHRRRRPGPGQRRPHPQWARDYWQELHPTSAGGYVNFLMNEGQDRVKVLPRQLRPARPGQGPLRPG